MGTRAALIVGLSNYDYLAPLCGASDARAVRDHLERNDDRVVSRSRRGSLNFECEVHTDIGPPPENIETPIGADDVLDGIRRLLESPHDVGLFYFAGPAVLLDGKAHLVTSWFNPDSPDGNESIAMSKILDIINASAARQVVVLLDCCYSGALAATMRADCQKGRSRYRPA
jgi:hypothetical protein